MASRLACAAYDLVSRDKANEQKTNKRKTKEVRLGTLVLYP